MTNTTIEYCGPTEADVLKAVVGLFTAKPSSAVLAHYPTLRIQTQNLVDALIAGMHSTDGLLDGWAADLAEGTRVAPEFLAAGTPQDAYRVLAPALVRNVHRTADFLIDEAQPTPPVDVDDVAQTTPSFSDFVKLGAAVRGLLDALVQAAYQLATFDGLQLNYKFLQSLLSFAAVAPESLHANIVSREMQTALDAYVSLTRKDRKNSPFTKASHEQFPQRLLVCARAVAFPDWRRHNLELLFSFCSDFVHSGYASVLAIGDDFPSIIVGGPGDAFTPKAENFAELKLRLLAECAGAYSDLLVPLLRKAMERTLASGVPASWADELDKIGTRIGSIRAILHRRLVEPVRCGLVGSDAVLQIRCMCGEDVQLVPPHDEWDRFCHACGSRFVLHELPQEVDYVISDVGVGDVLGADAIKVAALEQPALDKLNRIAAKHAPIRQEEALKFVLVTDLERCDEDTLQVPSVVTSAPSELGRKQCSLMAFVAAKSLERCAAVRVSCNCGADADYRTSDQTNVVTCPRCQTKIGLLGIAGDGKAVRIINTDGSPGSAPIQCRNRYAVPGVAIN